MGLRTDEKLKKKKISELWDIAIETTPNERESKELEDRRQSISEFKNLRAVSVSMYAASKEEERDEERNKIFEEIMVKTFPNLMKTRNPTIQEAQQSLCMSEVLGIKKGTSWFSDSHSSQTSSDDEISICGVKIVPCHEVGQSSRSLPIQWLSSPSQNAEERC